RERLFDVEAQRGAAAPVAGAWAAAPFELEERDGDPLAVAFVGARDLLDTGLAGVVDNAAAKRNVLHVIVREPGHAPTDGAVEALLRGAGLEVTCAGLGDGALAAAVAACARASGPRALLVTGGAASG